MTNGQQQPNKPIGPGGKGPGRGPVSKRSSFSWALIMILVMGAILLLRALPNDKITWNEFERYLQDDQIESIQIGDTEIKGKFREDVTDKDKNILKTFTVEYKADVVGEHLMELVKDKGIEWKFVQQNIWVMEYGKSEL